LGPWTAPSVESVVPAADGVAALGRTSDGNGAAWHSTDGSAWAPLDAGPDFTGGPVSAAASPGSRLLLLGSDQRNEVS
jgi:hypothetical protein